MTIIEAYIRRQFKKLNEDVVKELSHYLIDNNYQIDFDKMKYAPLEQLYLVSGSLAVHLYLQNVIDDEADKEFPAIILHEAGIINNEKSPFYGHQTYKGFTYYLTKKEIDINYFVYPDKYFLRGICGNITFKNDSFEGYIQYPKFESFDLNSPYLNASSMLSKRRLLLTFMGEIADKSVLTFYQRNLLDENGKEKIVI